MLPDYRNLLLADANNLLDEDNRPIGEIRANESVRHNVKTVYAVCPYSGSRNRTLRLINVSALKQVTSEWPEVLGLLDYVRNGCIPQSSKPPALIDLARTAAVALAVPSFLLYSEPCRFSSGQIPAFIAATHKMSAGLFGLCKNRLLSQVSLGKHFEDVTDSAATLYKYAEDSDALLSRTGIEACAGPQTLIMEALDLLVGGDCRSNKDTSPATNVIGNRERLISYSYAVIDVTIWLNIFAICCHEAVVYLHACIDEARNELDYALVASSRENATSFLSEGISDPTIQPILSLPASVQRQYAIGASRLFRYPDARRVSELLDWKQKSAPNKYHARSVDSTSQFIRSLGSHNMTCLLRKIIYQIQALEDEGLLIFFELQSRIHKALNLAPPLQSDVARVIDYTFGMLPSNHIAKVFRGRDTATLG